MNLIFDWLRVSTKKRNYQDRIADLQSQVLIIDEELNRLVEQVDNFVKIYEADMIKLVRVKDGNMALGSWVFPQVKQVCVVNRKGVKMQHSYPLRVRSFSRLSPEQKQEIKTMLQRQDDVFWQQLENFDKQRLSINLSLQMIGRLITQINQVQNNNVKETLQS